MPKSPSAHKSHHKEQRKSSLKKPLSKPPLLQPSPSQAGALHSHKEEFASTIFERMHHLEKALKQAQEETRLALAECGDVREINKTLRMQLSKTFDELNELGKKYEAKYVEHEQVKEQKAQHDKLYAQLEAKYDRDVSRFSAEHAQLEKLHGERLQKVKEEYAAAQSSLETALKEIETQLAASKEENKNLSQRFLDYEIVMQQKFKKAGEDYDAQIQRYDAELNIKNEEIKNLQQQVTEFETKKNMLKQLQEEQTINMERNDKLQAQLNGNQSLLQRYENELAKLQTEKHDLEKQLNQQQTQHQVALSQNDEQIAHLKNENVALENEKKRAVLELEYAKREVQRALYQSVALPIEHNSNNAATALVQPQSHIPSNDDNHIVNDLNQATASQRMVLARIENIPPLIHRNITLANSTPRREAARRENIEPEPSTSKAKGNKRAPKRTNRSIPNQKAKKQANEKLTLPKSSLARRFLGNDTESDEDAALSHYVKTRVVVNQFPDSSCENSDFDDENGNGHITIPETSESDIFDKLKQNAN